MRRFAGLCEHLSAAAGDAGREAALVDYFSHAADGDKMYALSLLSGNRPKRIFTLAQLQQWALEASGIPDWLFSESLRIVGDAAETIALILPQEYTDNRASLSEIMAETEKLRSADPDMQKTCVAGRWTCMTPQERAVYNKLLTGGFRTTAPLRLISRALSKVTGIDARVLTLRLSQKRDPGHGHFQRFISAKHSHEGLAMPFPFVHADELADDPATLGNPDEWTAEYRWDGLRAQLVFRGGELYIWSESGEILSEKFPEFQIMKSFVPDGCVLDGMTLPFIKGAPGSGILLEKRLTRKKPTRAAIEKTPAGFVAFDLPEYGGNDIREAPFAERRKILHSIIDENERIIISPQIGFNAWFELYRERTRRDLPGCSGLVIKHRLAPFQPGNNRWFRWDAPPFTMHAVLTFVSLNQGSMDAQGTECTFGLWQDDELVTVVKTGQGLGDEALHTLKKFVKENTLQRFGPVKQVKPAQVYEISFSGVNASRRHKSGVRIENPVIIKHLPGKNPEEAHNLDEVLNLIRHDTNA